MGPYQQKLVSTLAAIATASLGFIALPATGSAQPCSTGTDVRNVNDSAVSASLKTQILGSPGQIISNASSLYPSGKVVVIRAALQDAPVNPAATTSYINEVFFGPDQSERTLRGYYAANSYANFNISAGSVPDWFTLPKKITDYVNGIEANPTFLQDVLRNANVNWGALDPNHDGTIAIPDAQIVILVPNALPGSGFASTRVVNAGTVTTPTGTFTFSSRRIIIFSLKALADPQYNIDPIRALAGVAHELGHGFFNLPDRYGANTGTGEYDMMGSANSSTWVHLTMHDKMKIGWIKPKIVQGHPGQCLSFFASELQAEALVLVPPTSFINSPLEYWVVENRDKYSDSIGYDSDLPGHGLAVWYTSVGTFPNGYDDVRLVDYSKPDEDPDLYNNPGSNALFTWNPADTQRLLFDRNGHWNLLHINDISDATANFNGLYMFGQF
jgi:M6 family metalloprotease-like protein